MARKWLLDDQKMGDKLFMGFGEHHYAGFEGNNLKPGEWCDVGARYPCPDGGNASFSHHGGWDYGWEGSIFWNYKFGENKITEDEVAFWIDSAKKEHFFSEDRWIKYEENVI